jgi:hypothetical protein
MANQTVTKDKITVHGRGSVIIDYKVRDALGNQLDISGWDLWFEVDGLTEPIKEALVPDPSDPLGQRILLERKQVELLKLQPTKFALIDESASIGDVYRVLWNGTINRDGYLGPPDEISD